MAKEKKSSRVHVEGDKGRVSVDLNKSGSVRGYVEGGGRARSRREPKGEVHGGAGLQFRFGGKKKTRR